jgi:hypothetical protein
MTRHLQIFRSLWTNGFDLAAALDDVASGTFDGVEGPVPTDTAAKTVFITRLRDSGASFIAEVVTGGDYVPRHRSFEAHLDDCTRGIANAIEANARFCTVLAGCDAWPVDQSVEFLGRVIEIARMAAMPVSFETHRSRPTFNPWTTVELLRQLPELQLTCDFSHWCCVCERLVLDDEPELLDAVAGRAHHIHARVGYAQGPQVPHPAAPEYGGALEAHDRWWQRIIDSRPDNAVVTMTPEFGPDGYLQSAPFTGRAAADLNEINRWMAAHLRERFGSCGKAMTSHGREVAAISP